MLIPVKIRDSIEIKDIEIESTNFTFLNLREEHIEEFLGKNIEVIFASYIKKYKDEFELGELTMTKLFIL